MQISQNAPFCNKNMHTGTHFGRIVHWEILDLCIIGFAQQVYWPWSSIASINDSCRIGDKMYLNLSWFIAKWALLTVSKLINHYKNRRNINTSSPIWPLSALFPQVNCIYICDLQKIRSGPWKCQCLTHWGRMTHVCVNKLAIISSVNGLVLGRRQTIIWTNAVVIGPLETNFSGILIEINIFSFQKIHSKISSGKWPPFCLGINVLKLACVRTQHTRDQLRQRFNAVRVSLVIVKSLT